MLRWRSWWAAQPSTWRDQAAEQLSAGDGEAIAEKYRTDEGDEIPGSDPLVDLVVDGDRQLGRDMNGHTLYSERRQWCDELGAEGSFRQVLLELLDVCDHERHRLLDEQRTREQA